MPAPSATTNPSRRPSNGRLARVGGVMAPPVQRSTSMRTERPDPNAELHARERLRIVFAIGSLLLGLLAAAQA